jgi:hypothetical protein
MSRRRGAQTFYTTWLCPITSQRQRVSGSFAAVERICSRLRRASIDHRWGVGRR